MSPAHQITQSRFLPSDVTGVKVVLFDCDGVLCPPMRFADLLEREYQITRKMTLGFFSSAFHPALLGNADVLSLLPPFLAEWNWKESPERFLEIWLSSEREVRSEVVSMVNELRDIGYSVGVATNQEFYRAKYLREEMGFDKFFDRCFISCELGYMKPHTEYFQEVTKILGVAPQRIIFIDDQQSFLDAASAVGWHTILFRDAEDARGRLVEVFERTSRPAGT